MRHVKAFQERDIYYAKKIKSQKHDYYTAYNLYRLVISAEQGPETACKETEQTEYDSKANNKARRVKEGCSSFALPTRKTRNIHRQHRKKTRRNEGNHTLKKRHQIFHFITSCL